MKINQKIHTQIRLQNLLFTVLFLGAVGLAGWLSTRYAAQFDWTASGRNTLSEASAKVLELVKEHEGRGAPAVRFGSQDRAVWKGATDIEEFPPG